MWIKTFNKLPPFNTPVLTTCGDCTIFDVAECYLSENKVRWQQSSYHREVYPDHRFPSYWMPLPEAPEVDAQMVNNLVDMAERYIKSK
jgi:hypothetical protein